VSDATQRDAAWLRLRARAEALLRHRHPDDAQAIQPQVDEILHEVEVQRAELEIQNEELRAAEERLGRAQRRYFSLFDRSPVGVFVLRPDGTVEEVNSTARAWLNLPERSAYATTLGQLLRVPENRVQSWLEFFKHHATVAATLHVQVARPDGELLDLELIGAQAEALGDGQASRTLICATNLTELRARERELARSEVRYRQLFQSSRDAILLLDEHFTIVDLNAAAISLMPGRDEPLAGRSISELTAPELVPVIENEVSVRSRRWVSQPFDFLVRRGAGAPVICEATVFPLDLPDGPVAQVVMRDVTERRRAEAERERWARRLDVANRLESVARLARGVAHEVNNVLAALMGHLEGLPSVDGLRRLTDEEFGAMRSALLRGRDVARGLLDFAGESTSSRARFDLAAVVDDAASLVRQAGRGLVRVTVNRPERALFVLADRSEISRALIDVCTRAISAMPDGGVLGVTVAVLERPSAAGQPAVEHYRVDVSDTGDPLSPDECATVFDPFVSGGRMGLSLVWGAVKRAGGSVRVDAGMPGTVVSLELPAAPAPVALPAEEAPVPGPGSEGGALIFLVDDDDLPRNAMTRMLMRRGYRVRPFPGAEPALVALATGDRPDVLVTDVRMPGMDGIELTRRVLALSNAPPVLLISGDSEVDVARELGVRRGVGMLSKPFGHDEFAQAVRPLLARRS
jgi:two-component system cell cycle sensor histidine kinase/response regulator CckA